MKDMQGSNKESKQESSPKESKKDMQGIRLESKQESNQERKVKGN